MVRQHHQLNRHESEQTPGDSGGQRRLACCMQSMGLQRVGHDLVTEQQQEQIYRPYSILTTCPTNGPHGKRKKKLWFKIQFRMLYFIQLSGHFSFLQSGKFFIYMYIYIYISLSFLTWTLRKKKKKKATPATWGFFRPLALLINQIQIWGLLCPVLGLVHHQNDSQNSLLAISLTHYIPYIRTLIYVRLNVYISF